MKRGKIFGVCLIALSLVPFVYYMIKQVGAAGAAIVFVFAIASAVAMVVGVNLLLK